MCIKSDMRTTGVTKKILTVSHSSLKIQLSLHRYTQKCISIEFHTEGTTQPASQHPNYSVSLHVLTGNIYNEHTVFFLFYIYLCFCTTPAYNERIEPWFWFAAENVEKQKNRDNCEEFTRLHIVLAGNKQPYILSVCTPSVTENSKK